MKLLPAALVLALPAIACSFPPPREASAAPRAAAARPAGADAARLTRDVAWLADDARQGRRAGTQGESVAAEWIAARLAELGLEPAGEGGWFQAVEVPLEPEAGGKSWLLPLPEGDAPTDATPLTGEDSLAPLFCSAGGGESGPLAFRGYGLTSAELGWNDWAERCDGAVALVVRGTPDLPQQGTAEAVAGAQAAANPHGGDVSLVSRSATFGSSGSIFSKVMTAKRMGAVAVLLAQHPDDAGQPLLAFHNGHTAMASLPALTVSAAVAERLLPGYAERVRAIDARALAAGQRDPASSAAGGAVALSADVRRGKGTARNVLGLLRGGGSGRTVVLGAHFDHLGLGGSGSLARDAWGEVHNGADDNASGTAVVLELARLLARGPRLSDDVLFALWSGEELGLLGSDHWAKHPTVPLERVAVNLNFDMVGRADDGSLQVLGAGTSPAFAAWLEEAGARADLELAVSLSGRGVGGSDHQTFLKQGIPALHFFSGVHTDYHKPSDDADRFEADGARRTVELARDLVARIDGAAELPFSEVAEETAQEEGRQGSGWTAWFGSIPSGEAYGGATGGVKIDGTSPGSPAERAGFLPGDVLTRVGDIEIDDIYDFTYALQAHKPGDVVTVAYLRDDREESLQLTLGSRELE